MTTYTDVTVALPIIEIAAKRDRILARTQPVHPLQGVRPMANSDAILVKGYADLISDPKLEDNDPDIIARELQEHGGNDEYMVVWLPDWIVDEKDIEPIGRSEHVASGRVDHETEKAYLLVDGRNEAWLPKSVIHVFRAPPDVEISIPQCGLSDFREGSA